jgi:hypothetical protein
MKTSVPVFGLLFFLTLSVGLLAQTPALPHRWIYLQTGLLPDAHRAKTMALLDRIAAEGYNGVVFADYKFMRWDTLPPEYTKHWRELRDTCSRLKLTLIAAVMPMGYSNSLLSRDPNLAEGVPIRDAPFIILQGTLVPNESVPILNGGFEVFKNNTPSEWAFVDSPGEIAFRDTAVKSTGTASLRMQEVARYEPRHRHARVCQKLKLAPFRAYHVSVSVKTQDWDAEDTRIMALGADGRTLNFQTLPILKTMDWTRLDITFNTLDSAEVSLYLGTWAGSSGTIWWDDVRVEPAGFVNVLRRAGTPLRITSNSGAIVYEEGRDFETVRDPLTGMDPCAGDSTAWHTPPVIRLLPGSRLQEGQRIRASYYHASVINEGSVACCMSDPKVYEILTEQAKQVRDNLHPDGYLMSHDEIRVQGWDESCARRGLTAAEILADNVDRCVDILKKADPGKPLFIWSDMFDPNHNARPSGFYYLVKGKGPWNGAWKGLPHDVTVINWQMNPNTRRDTLSHFSDLGNRQILAGYYDGDPRMIRSWLKDAKGIPGVNGVMYTTWCGNFNRTREFLEAAK